MQPKRNVKIPQGLSCKLCNHVPMFAWALCGFVGLCIQRPLGYWRFICCNDWEIPVFYKEKNHITDIIQAHYTATSLICLYNCGIYSFMSDVLCYSLGKDFLVKEVYILMVTFQKGKLNKSLFFLCNCQTKCPHHSKRLSMEGSVFWTKVSILTSWWAMQKLKRLFKGLLWLYQKACSFNSFVQSHVCHLCEIQSGSGQLDQVTVVQW